MECCKISGDKRAVVQLNLDHALNVARRHSAELHIALSGGPVTMVNKNPKKGTLPEGCKVEVMVV